MRKFFILTVTMAAMLLTVVSCRESMDALTDRVFDVASRQFTLLSERLQPGDTPRSFNEEGVVDMHSITWWCSGFFPGSLWYVYEYTGDESIKALAWKETHKLDNIVSLHTDHDIGFQVNCSFGNAWRLTGDECCLPVIESAAAKFAGRFSPVTGVTMSWEPNPSKGWTYPVIIDNMMNLELLELASKLFACDSLEKIALCHARTTIANHFRDDYTTFHVVDYDPQTGEVRSRVTHQGYSNDSAWGRGQSWALYGFTMMYRETGLEEFRNQAENVAAMLLKRLPADGIPYWDFDDPRIPDINRDASAGAVMASGFAQLYSLTGNREYLKMAEKQIRTLASEEYLAKVGENGNFLLKHSVGNMPVNGEVDVALTYADYYFLEALLKYREAVRK